MIILEEFIRALLTVGIAFAIGSYIHSSNHEQNTIEQRHYQKQLQKIERDNLKLQQQLLTQNATEKIRYIKIKEYIHDYAATKNGHTQLNAKFVRIHDIGAQPEMPDATSATVTHGTTAAVALNIVTNNYQLCNEYKAKLIAWQTWYKNNQQVLNGKSK